MLQCEIMYVRKISSLPINSNLRLSEDQNEILAENCRTKL